MSKKLLLGIAIFIGALPANAEITSSSPAHYVLNHQASSLMAPSELWDRLVQPAMWWHPGHTYSGDANNLTLELKAGGYWLERWGDNSVLHGVVLNVDKEKLLRLDAPFGPLQGMAVKVVWTIKIEAQDQGSIVTFEELASGVPTSKLDELAKAVDFVKSEALTRLVNK